jgi:hypothetical protein
VAYLVTVLASIALLAGFFALTCVEKRRGTRVLAPARDRLDQKVSRIEFILAHVDLAEFARDEVRRAINRIGHDVAHLTLQVVRSAERLLTRAVRYLRSQQDVDATPRESSRPFVKTLSDFKDRLKASRPDFPEIQ